MSSLYNRYGMPNANYNQPADTNPIDAGVRASSRHGAQVAPGSHPPAAPNSPVTRDGGVNLGAMPQPLNPAQFANPIGDIGASAVPPASYPTAGTAAPPRVAAPQAPPEALGLISQLQGGLPPTSASLDPIISALQAKGYDAKRATHAGNLPSDDKMTVNGSMYDLIGNVGGPGASWTQNFVDPNPPASSSNQGALANALMAPSYGAQMNQGILQSLATKFALR